MGDSSELLGLLFYFSFECFWKKLGQYGDPVKNHGNFVGPGRKNPPKNVENRDRPGKTPKSEVPLEGNHDPIWDKFGFSENFRPPLLHLQQFIPNRPFHEILDRGSNIAPHRE